MKEVTAGLDVGDGAVRVGLVPKDCKAVNEFSLKDSIDKQTVLNFLDHELESAPQSIGDVMKYIRKESFSHGSTTAEAGQKFSVIFVDDSVREWGDITREVRRAERNGIRTFVVSIGDVDPDKVQSLASAPASTHVIYTKSYQELLSRPTDLVDQLNSACSFAGNTLTNPQQTPSKVAIILNSILLL